MRQSLIDAGLKEGTKSIEVDEPVSPQGGARLPRH